MACEVGKVLTQCHFVPCNSNVYRGMRFDYTCAQVLITSSSTKQTSCNLIDGKETLYLDRHDMARLSSTPFMSSWKMTCSGCSGPNLQHIEYTCNSASDDCIGNYVSEPRSTIEDGYT